MWLRRAQTKKTIWTSAIRAPRKPVGPLTKPNYLASNQLNIKILQALPSKMLTPPREACVQKPTSMRPLIFLLPHLTPVSWTDPLENRGFSLIIKQNPNLNKHHCKTLTLRGLTTFGGLCFATPIILLEQMPGSPSCQESSLLWANHKFQNYPVLDLKPFQNLSEGQWCPEFQHNISTEAISSNILICDRILF